MKKASLAATFALQISVDERPPRVAAPKPPPTPGQKAPFGGKQASPFQKKGSVGF